MIKEFSYYYYGDAYNYVLSYFELLEKSLRDSNSNLKIKTSVNSEYLNEIFIKNSKVILDLALNSVEKNSVYYDHLIELYSGIDYIEFMRGTISKENKKRFKITPVEIFVLFLVVLGFSFYFVPKAMINGLTILLSKSVILLFKKIYPTTINTTQREEIPIKKEPKNLK